MQEYNYFESVIKMAVGAFFIFVLFHLSSKQELLLRVKFSFIPIHYNIKMSQNASLDTLVVAVVWGSVRTVLLKL